MVSEVLNPHLAVNAIGGNMSWFRELRVHLSLMLTVLVASGCSTKAGWQYIPSSAQQANVQVPLVVAVEHFQDQRGSDTMRFH